MTKKEQLLKKFDREFTRSDGLIDKYSFYGVEGELHPQPTPKAIKQFISESIESVLKDVLSGTVELTDSVEEKDIMISPVIMRKIIKKAQEDWGIEIK